ncbi:MAG: hypothetical protein ABL986_08950 [Vicinamibacterales bacterium]
MRGPAFVLLSILSGAITGTGVAAYLATTMFGRSTAPAPSPSPAAAPSAAAPVVAHPRPIQPAVAVAPALQGLSQAFLRQLSARGDGTLVALSERDGDIEARWSSPTCDWTETEFLDLVDAVRQEFTGSVRSITGVRECSGSARRYLLTGHTFELYHAGKVSNRDVLRYLIEITSEK